MSAVEDEIRAIEERLRQAELGPDPDFFQEALADNAVMVSEGQPAMAKAMVVESHRPGKGPKFTRVEMNNLQIVEHGSAAVVTCQGLYESAQSTFTLSFLRVWLKTNDRWQIIAGSISMSKVV